MHKNFHYFSFFLNNQKSRSNLSIKRSKKISCNGNEKNSKEKNTESVFGLQAMDDVFPFVSQSAYDGIFVVITDRGRQRPHSPTLGGPGGQETGNYLRVFVGHVCTSSAAAGQPAHHDLPGRRAHSLQGGTGRAGGPPGQPLPCPHTSSPRRHRHLPPHDTALHGPGTLSPWQHGYKPVQ